jgi:hypothetical protein
VGTYSQEFTAGGVLAFYDPSDCNLYAAYVVAAGGVSKFPVGNFIDEWMLAPATTDGNDVLAFYNSAGMLSEADLGSAPTKSPYYIGPWSEEWTGSSNTGGLNTSTDTLVFYYGGSITPVDPGNITPGDVPPSPILVGTAVSASPPLAAAALPTPIAGEASAPLGAALPTPSAVVPPAPPVAALPAPSAPAPPASPAATTADTPPLATIDAAVLSEDYKTFNAVLNAIGSKANKELKLLKAAIDGLKAKKEPVTSLEDDILDLKVLADDCHPLSDTNIASIVSELKNLSNSPHNATLKGLLTSNVDRLTSVLAARKALLNTISNVSKTDNGRQMNTNSTDAQTQSAFAIANSDIASGKETADSAFLNLINKLDIESFLRI